AFRGHFTAPDGPEEYCARRLLARIHHYTRARQRREIEPVTARDFMRFLLRWQHVAPDAKREGRLGVLSVVEQLQGFELAAGAWGGGSAPPPGGASATGGKGGTSGACPAPSRGAGCRPARPPGARSGPAAAVSRPRERRRSRWRSARTCPGCSRPRAASARRA